MKSETTNKILADLEVAISSDPKDEIKPLPCCKWVASSTWQKSIRRGLTETALRAAATFWQADARNFYRRCILLVCEDIGPGSMDTVTKVLTACADASWRKRVGDLKTALHLTRLMCAANKSRLSDQIFILAEKASEHAHCRRWLGTAGSETLKEYTLQPGVPLTERALSLWAIAGTEHYCSGYLPKRNGSLKEAASVMRLLNEPSDLTEACIGALVMTQYPLPLLMPLLTHAARQMPRPFAMCLNKLSSPEMYEGIPLFALDTFTRNGKFCIQKLQQTVPDFRQFNATQIGLGIFYMEGRMVDKELMGPELEEFKQAGEIADIENSGLCLPRYLGLRECLEQHWPILEEIRCKELRRYLNQWQEERQFEERLI